MENSLNFKIGKELFSITKLINSHRSDSEVNRLIKTFECNIEDCMNNEPCKEDILSPYDNWSSFASDRLGISFELIEDQLCYISFNIKLNPSIPIAISNEKDIVIGLIRNNKDEVTDISFGSKSLIFEKELYPSRWSPILESLINGQFCWI